jgi:hypothetical protein
VEEIATHSTRPIVIALDQDATSKAFQHAERYSLMLDSPIVMPLDKDFKDMTDEELKGTLL